MVMKTLICISYIIMASMLSDLNSDKHLDTGTVVNVSLERYMGLWYEIARIDHIFQKGLLGCTANYTLRPDGKVDVVNKGFVSSLDGEINTAKGVAKMPDPKEPGRLKVAFLPGLYSEYNILELDTVNYSYALVGGSSDGYLWILSRTPHISKDIQDLLVERATKRGYETDRLIFPQQIPSE